MNYVAISLPDSMSNLVHISYTFIYFSKKKEEEIKFLRVQKVTKFSFHINIMLT